MSIRTLNQQEIIMTKSTTALHHRHNTIQQHWIKQSQNDPEFGGRQFEQNLKLAKRAVDRFGGQKLRNVLEETGMGNHPEIIRCFWKVGRALTQHHGTGEMRPVKPANTNIADLLYPGFNGDKKVSPSRRHWSIPGQCRPRPQAHSRCTWPRKTGKRDD